MLIDPVGNRLGERHEDRVDQQINSGRNVDEHSQDWLHAFDLRSRGPSQTYRSATVYLSQINSDNVQRTVRFPGVEGQVDIAFGNFQE